jgi:hypothetical protein
LDIYAEYLSTPIHEISGELVSDAGGSSGDDGNLAVGTL